MAVPLPQASRAILVAGGGGIGALYAAHLAKLARVVVYDLNAAHVEAIRRDGLRIDGKTELVARVEASASAEALAGRHFDAVLVMVKSMFTEELITTLRGRLAGRPLLLSVQNGQGNVGILETCCDWDILHGMTWEAGEYLAPGQVRHTVHGPESWVGPARGRLQDCAWLGELIDLAGLPTRVVPDARNAVWSKFIFNCAMNPVAALVGGNAEAKYLCDDTYQLLRTLVAEGTAVAQALGITPLYDPLRLVEQVRAGATPMPSHPGSMTLDLRRGTPTEIEGLDGYMLRKARELGIAAPAHEVVYRLLKGLEFGLNAERKASIAR